MAIAYIISAFRNPNQLSRLINRLDEPDASFIIHIDSRSIPDFAEVLSSLSRCSNVVFLQPRRFRYRSFDHVQISLSGLDMLIRSETPFDHVVLLTGQDYPIKSLSSIRSLLSRHKGESYIDFSHLPNKNWHHGGLNRIETWHFFTLGKHIVHPAYSSNNRFKRKFPEGFEPYGGMGYWCLARNAIEYLLKFVPSHPEFVRFFRYVDIPDELFFHTILLNSPLRDRLINDDLRYIVWDKPTPPYPAILTINDFSNLKSSNDLFARKFDTSIDKEILDIIDEQILNAPTYQ